VHKYADLLKLYELDKVSLDDLWDEDWAIIQNILLKNKLIKFKNPKKQNVFKDCLGKTKKDLIQNFKNK
jgi:hypothetical protein